MPARRPTANCAAAGLLQNPATAPYGVPFGLDIQMDMLRFIAHLNPPGRRIAERHHDTAWSPPQRKSTASIRYEYAARQTFTG